MSLMSTLCSVPVGESQTQVRPSEYARLRHTSPAPTCHCLRGTLRALVPVRVRSGKFCGAKEASDREDVSIPWLVYFLFLSPYCLNCLSLRKCLLVLLHSGYYRCGSSRGRHAGPPASGSPVTVSCSALASATQLLWGVSLIAGNPSSFFVGWSSKASPELDGSNRWASYFNKFKGC